MKESPDSLFNLYSVNASYHDLSIQDSFVCPLCMRIFSRELIDCLSIEHIIPSNLSGKLITLTCKACNNTTGSILDAQVVKRIRTEDAFVGYGTIRGKVKSESGECTGEIVKTGESSYHIMPLPQYSNPVLFKNVFEDIKKDKAEITFTSEPLYNTPHSTLGYLRAAYLMMFYYFGYGYVKYRYITDPIRMAILNHTDDTPFLNSVFRLHFGFKGNTVAALTNPPEHRCFLVLLDYSTNTDRAICIALPGLWQEGHDNYQSLLANIAFNKKLSGSWCPIRYHESILTNKANEDAVDRLWQHILTNSPFVLKCH